MLERKKEKQEATDDPIPSYPLFPGYSREAAEVLSLDAMRYPSLLQPLAQSLPIDVQPSKVLTMNYDCQHLALTIRIMSNILTPTHVLLNSVISSSQ